MAIIQFVSKQCSIPQARQCVHVPGSTRHPVARASKRSACNLTRGFFDVYITDPC